MSILCTKANPWKPEMGTPVEHEGCYEIGEQEDGWPGGDIIRRRCPNCGTEWTEELPQ